MFSFEVPQVPYAHYTAFSGTTFPTLHLKINPLHMLIILTSLHILIWLGRLFYRQNSEFYIHKALFMIEYAT